VIYTILETKSFFIKFVNKNFAYTCTKVFNPVKLFTKKTLFPSLYRDYYTPIYNPFNYMDSKTILLHNPFVKNPLIIKKVYFANVLAERLKAVKFLNKKENIVLS